MAADNNNNGNRANIAELRCCADLSQLASVLGFVEDTGRELGLDQGAITDLQLVVDEAYTNVVRHGYGLQGGQVEIAIEPADEGVQVTIRDWGAPFDPLGVHTPDVMAPLEQRPLGGLGLHLMRQMMDRVSFQFDGDEGNTLTLLKRLHPEG